jgi:UDP-2-acetamido-3-amino-2,3-dideoxy-glucuronate N-acetyltransferase
METFIHERAICETEKIGAQTRIWGDTHILRDASIGKHCNIGERVFIESDVRVGHRCIIKNNVSLWDGITLEDDVFVGPQVVFTNDLKPRAFLKKKWVLMPTLIKRGATLGANSTIICVGAGAVVTEDVPPHALILGVPGKICGKVCFCGEKLRDGSFCSECLLTLPENSFEKVKKIYSPS